MGHGTMTPETRYGAARRIAREESERADLNAGLLVHSERECDRLRKALEMARDELHGTAIALQRAEERIAEERATMDGQRDEMDAAASCLMDMIAEAASRVASEEE